MNRTEKYFHTLLLSLLLFSCETIVDVELPKHKPMIVVNGVCNPDKTLMLNLSLSKGVLEEGDIESLTDASIIITEDDNSISDFSYLKNGSYKASGFKPKANVEYKLRVSKTGFETVTSSCVIPSPIPIESIDIDTLNGIDGRELELTISFTDAPNRENYYGLEIFAKSRYSDTTEYYPTSFSSNDLLISKKDGFEETERSYYNGRTFFDDAVLNGKNYKLRIYVQLWFGGTEDIKVVLSSLNKDYYKYVQTRDSQIENDNNPFSEPVIIYNNIKNGLGIFAGYSSFTYEL